MESIRAHAQILKCLLFKIDISTPPPNKIWQECLFGGTFLKFEFLVLIGHSMWVLGPIMCSN